MNYTQARQRGEGGPWHFTTQNDDRVWPVGCTADCTHTSSTEACQHWVELTIAEGVRWGECSWTTCSARNCEYPAKRTAHIGTGGTMSTYMLCAEHATDKIAAELFREDHAGSFKLMHS